MGNWNFLLENPITPYPQLPVDAKARKEDGAAVAPFGHLTTNCQQR